MLVDQTFLLLMDQRRDFLLKSLPSKEYRILNSIEKSISSVDFITENQSKLLVIVINNNLDIFSILDPNINNIIESNTWSKPFRKITMIKNLYLKGDSIHIEFEGPGKIKRKLHELITTNTEFSVIQDKTKMHYVVSLSEKHVKYIVDGLSKFNFEIDPILAECYSTINNWDFEVFKNKYLINTIENDRFKKLIAEDLGIDTPLTQNLINDRSHRYQYYVDRLAEPKNLTEIIANRESTSVWVESSKYQLSDTVKALIELKRLPILVVFPASSAIKSSKLLKMLHEALDENNISNVGIYFRVKNEDTKSEFNQMISDYQYNNVCTSETQVVGVQNGKIPKFLLSLKWIPMSILTLEDSLKSNKTATFTNNCDCIISYTENKPLIPYGNTFNY